MSFKTLSYKRVYVSGLDNLVRDFYIPVLSNSVLYKRGTGYFNSRALAIAARGISGLLKNKGKMQLLCSVELDAEDESVLRDPLGYLQNIQERVLTELDSPYDDLEKKRLAILAELLSRGSLEIRICLKQGGIYHAKTGIFQDTEGNQVVFDGSGNETPGGWFRNQEKFNVFKSWEQPEYVNDHIDIFENEWEGRYPYIETYTVTQAFVNGILRFRDYYEEGYDEPYDPIDLKYEKRWEWTPELAYIFEAPRLWNHADFAFGDTAVTPFEHQDYIAAKALESWPPRFLLCDEVGLGKTIEAGLIIHGYVASGLVNRLIILAPKNALVQWQQELLTKFGLKIWRLDGRYVYGPKLHPDIEAEREPINPENPFATKDFMLVSSQLVRLRERAIQLLNRNYDMVVVDEAHHARARYDGERRSPNKLLSLLKDLRYQTQSFLLLTATPIQVDRRELWDLLNLLELPGKWQDPDKFDSFVELMDKEPIQWDFLIGMVKDSIDYLGLDQDGIERVREKYPNVNLFKLQNIIKDNEPQLAYQLTDKEKDALKLMIYMNTPIRRMVFRNTRKLLKSYIEKGKFSGKIATREPEKIPVELLGDPSDPYSEAGLYQRIETYVKEYYGKYKNIRKGLGFIMVIYRKRLTSSFEAIRISLKRRHERLKTALESGDFYLLFSEFEKDEIIEDEDPDEMELVSKDLEDVISNLSVQKRLKKIVEEEFKYIDDFIMDLENLTTDSKFDHFNTLIRKLTDEGTRQIIVFSQFKDTVDYLKDNFAPIYGARIGTYTGDGGLYYLSGDWHSCSKQKLQEKFRDPEDDLSILFCTDAASESLNLQTCSVIFNYDIPWNPMRIEQRIGRVDRIGQESPVVYIYTYSYKDTVEDLAFDRCLERIDFFRSTLGYVQPILEATKRAIKEGAMEMESGVYNPDIYFEGVAEVEEGTRIQHLVNEYKPQLNTLKDKVPITQEELETYLSPRLEGYGWRKEGNVWINGNKRITFDVEAYDRTGEEARLVTPRSSLISLFGNLPEIPKKVEDNGKKIYKIEARSYTGFLKETEGGYKLITSIDDIDKPVDGKLLNSLVEGVRYLDHIILDREMKNLKTQLELWNNREESWKVRVRMYLDSILLYLKKKEIQPESLDDFDDEKIVGLWRRYLNDPKRKGLKNLATWVGYSPDPNIQDQRDRRSRSSPKSSYEEMIFKREIQLILKRKKLLEDQIKMIKGRI